MYKNTGTEPADYTDFSQYICFFMDGSDVYHRAVWVPSKASPGGQKAQSACGLCTAYADFTLQHQENTPERLRPCKRCYPPAPPSQL